MEATQGQQPGPPVPTEVGSRAPQPGVPTQPPLQEQTGLCCQPEGYRPLWLRRARRPWLETQPRPTSPIQVPEPPDKGQPRRRGRRAQSFSSLCPKSLFSVPQEALEPEGGTHGRPGNPARPQPFLPERWANTPTSPGVTTVPAAPCSHRRPKAGAHCSHLRTTSPWPTQEMSG